jgi:hypothetical protein
MSFFQRIFSAGKTLAGAIYNASVEAFKEVVGRSAEEKKKMIKETIEDESISPMSVSDGSDIHLEFDSMSDDDILQSILNELNGLSFINGQYYVLEIKFDDAESKNIIINPDNLEDVKNKIKAAIDGNLQVNSESDKIVYSIVHGDPVSADFISKHQQSLLDVEWLENSGGLFLYRHNITNKYVSELLETLEIYHKDSDCKPDLCFLSAIKGKVSDEVFASIARKINCKRVSTKMIVKLCSEFKIKITVNDCKEVDGKFKTKVHNYGGVGDLIKICLFDEHYFKYTELPIEYKSDWIDYVSSNLGGNGKANTLSLVKFLMINKDKYLISLNETQQFYYREPSSDFVGIKKIDDHMREVTIPEPKGELTIPIIYFDFETTTRGVHSVYHLSFGIDYDGKFIKGRINNRPADEIINTYLSAIAQKFGVEGNHSRKPDVLMLAHNATYDTSFILDV